MFDLFWTYREGNNARWYGYQAQRSKYRRSLPLFSKVCSGDLFGYRFSVPCSPIEYLDHEYGKNNWTVPLRKDYGWINMKYHSMWNDISWMYAVRLYSPEGHLRSDELAISWVAKRFNYTYASVPSFLNALPNESVTLPPLKSEFVRIKPQKVEEQETKPALEQKSIEKEEQEEEEELEGEGEENENEGQEPNEEGQEGDTNAEKPNTEAQKEKQNEEEQNQNEPEEEERRRR